MDDATYTHLVKHRISCETSKPKFDVKYKDKIIEVTKQIMDNKLNGPLKEAFEAYASECIAHFETPVITPAEQKLTCDTILQPKKIHYTFKKNIYK